MLRQTLCALSLALSAGSLLAQTDLASLRSAAEAGDRGAAFDFGYELTFPETGSPDYETGRYWLTRAADADLAYANYVLGQIYLDGIGTDADPDRARAFFELAWHAEDAAAGYALAELLLYDYEDEESEAFALLETLADDPDFGALARLTLADALFFGSEDAADIARAVELAGTALALDPGLTNAHYLLGIAAMEGLGREVDGGAALDHWMQGSRGGDTLAMLALADALMDGVSGETDPVEARAWYGVAASFGDDDALDTIETLDASLPPETLAQARARMDTLLTEIE
ncbi:tetratricopeptide repeat protein [Maricaulis parjimensis]|uniref:tetratricopeptide repeat protein n=1 Tax=Maricaulis parjimensis TaxID=144023 RepID=UPI00193A31DE|nr:SEL1-like repeat protein [Maricaulis parjimensis]